MYSLVIEFRKYASSHRLTSGIMSRRNPILLTFISRGAGAQELIDNPLWWNGPEFLWNPCKDWDSVNDNPSIPLDDPEVKKVSARATQIQDPKLPSVLERLNHFSSWYRAKKAIAVCLRLQQKF